MTRVLLADDHALVRAGLRDALSHVPGVSVVGEVSNGRDLPPALATWQPDLLVMDVNMPEFEPVAAVQQMRAAWPALKILVVSAHDDQAYVVGLLAAGVDGYHLKDQPLADLQLAVQKIVAGERWISGPLVGRLVAATTTPPAPLLTRRQSELLYFLAQGYDNRHMAQEMNLSVKTVENHLTALYRALGVESRLEAHHYASQHPEVLVGSGPPRPAPTPVVEARPAAQLTVLVVDDNARYRAQLSKLLSKVLPTATLAEAGDCAEATRLAQQLTLQLALVDVVLPGEDGIQCLRQLKQISPHTRVVLISAYPDREFRRLGLNAGAVALIDKKDLDTATLRAVVEDALGQQ